MHAFLFIGATETIRRQAIAQKIADWHSAPFDVIVVEPVEEHITIDDIRLFKRRLMLVPTKSEYLVGALYQAKSMTKEAQNALLKLLEEPPPRVKILIESEHADMLLSTIISRCEIVRVAGNSDPQTEIPLLALMDAPIGERLSMLETYTKDRMQAKAFVQDALSTGEKMLHTYTDRARIAVLLRRLEKAQAQLSVNCNPKLVLDRAFFL